MSKLAQRVFLHIGAPKTGTTYLQGVLQANREALAAQGVLYATGTSPRDRVWATEVLRGLNLSRHPKPQAAGAWDRIVAQVQRWPGTAVISHEFFGACSEEQAGKALRDLAPAEIHLVFTARDYVSQAGAVWQERLKYGHPTKFGEFRLDAADRTPMWSWRTQDLIDILARWRHDLPPSRVHVVTVPRGGRPAELWERFASVLGVDPTVATDEPHSANTSLGLVEAELLRRVDERVRTVLTGPREHARWVRDLLANRVLAQGSRERFTVSGAYAEELSALARGTVAGIVEAGYDVVGTLDELLPPDPLPVTRTPDEATTDELLEAAIEAIVGLLAEARRASSAQRERADLGRGSRGSGRPRPPTGSADRAPSRQANGSGVRRLVTTLTRARRKVMPRRRA